MSDVNRSDFARWAIGLPHEFSVEFKKAKSEIVAAIPVVVTKMNNDVSDLTGNFVREQKNRIVIRLQSLDIPKKLTDGGRLVHESILAVRDPDLKTIGLFGLGFIGFMGMVVVGGADRLNMIHMSDIFKLGNASIGLGSLLTGVVGGIGYAGVAYYQKSSKVSTEDNNV